MEKKVQEAEVEKILLSTCTEQWLNKWSSEQEREYSEYTPQAILWFYLWDYREDMR